VYATAGTGTPGTPVHELCRYDAYVTVCQHHVVINHSTVAVQMHWRTSRGSAVEYFEKKPHAVPLCPPVVCNLVEMLKLSLNICPILPVLPQIRTCYLLTY